MYRNCDNVWSLVFKKMEITFNDQNQSNLSIAPDNKVKIVACEGKSDKKVIYFFQLNLATQSISYMKSFAEKLNGLENVLLFFSMQNLKLPKI